MHTPSVHKATSSVDASDQSGVIPGLPGYFRTQPGEEPTFHVPDRQAFTLNSFRLENNFVDKEPYRFDIRDYTPVITVAQIRKYVQARIPILVWLRHYNWKQDILADVIGGITLGVLRVPQAMAYALLAQVLPVYGLYTCLFSCLIYTILGSSRHVSVGAFSVLCLMMGTVVNKHIPAPAPANVTSEETNDQDKDYEFKKIQMLTAMCFIVGIMHLVLGILKLGALSIFMSETLVSGFTTGAACHVFTSQVPLLLGVKISAKGGIFYIFKVYYQVCEKLPETNYVTASISVIALTLLIFTMNCDVGHFKKKTGLPLPMELTIVIVITLISHFIKLNEVHNVEIVGEIHAGLLAPRVPDFNIMPGIIVDSIPIAIVSYVVSFSMGLIFAKKYKYRVYANQELFALGTANVFCSFFSSFPVSVALARTLVKEKAGCRTQLASFISCWIILAVLLWVGFLLRDLPTCILGAIVMAAVQGMFFQIKDLILAWKLSILDALVWLVSFISVFLVGTAYGLFIGIAFSLFTIILRTMNIRAFKIQFTEPQACLVGAIPDTDIYVDILKYTKVKSIPGIKIFRFNGPIHFANRQYFKSRLHDLIDVTTTLTKESRSRRLTVHASEQRPSIYFADLVRFIILDCSGCPYIDLSGLSTLHETIVDYQGEFVSVHLAACQDPVLDMLKHTKFETKAPNSCIFPTIHDAVLYCLMARNASMHYINKV